MNILYCTFLSDNKGTGLYWSIPNQVKAQSKYDCVFWYNMTLHIADYWEATGFYHCLNEFPSKKIKDLPIPFNKPDLVVFESFYVHFYFLYLQVKQMNIPYVIVPRGALTCNAQRKKCVKKVIGNLIFWHKFAQNALAIHYLTRDECLSSGSKWNKRSFIVPNGVITMSDKQWKNKIYEADKNEYKGVFIGRLSIFHKGLDLLVEACNLVRKELRDAHFVFHIYGPDIENEKVILEKKIIENDLSDILLLHDKVFDKQKEDVLLSCDFFILTSRLEGHPMALIEALSYGLPCFVTTGSNMREEIENGEAGWGADNSVESIAGAVKRMVSEKYLFNDKSKNAITIAQKYKWDEIAFHTHNSYVELLKQK